MGRGVNGWTRVRSGNCVDGRWGVEGADNPSDPA